MSTKAHRAAGRLATPEKIAGAAFHLASDNPAFITASLLAIDGGWTAQ